VRAIDGPHSTFADPLNDAAVPQYLTDQNSSPCLNMLGGAWNDRQRSSNCAVQTNKKPASFADGLAPNVETSYAFCPCPFSTSIALFS
jgi:hypothetical protein